MSISTTQESLVSELLRLNLLKNWYSEVSRPDRWLLISEQAVASVSVNYGLENAKKFTSDAFLYGENLDKRVSLTNLRFASTVMTEPEFRAVLHRLESGDFTYDPRSVISLADISFVDKNLLINLIKKKAYSSKSMSSFMTDAASLGDTEYIYVMAKDVANNASQPSNFYCSACALSLYTDGIIGEHLVAAAISNEIYVDSSEGNLIIKSTSPLMELKNNGQ